MTIAIDAYGVARSRYTRRERSLLAAEKVTQELRYQMANNAFDSERLLILIGQWTRLTGRRKWEHPKVIKRKIHR